MKHMNKKKIIALFTIFLFVSFLLNLNYKVISMPTGDILIQRQIDYITISTVFAGFSFTTLGLLFGMSSERLIEAIEGTSIMNQKAYCNALCKIKGRKSSS